ncbi:MAG TPA: ATP-binding protein [Burkholderiales bacterium]
MRDFAIVFGSTLLVAILSARLELSERLNAWTRAYEHWQLDELVLVLLALALGLAWFAARRWRESRRTAAEYARSEAEIARLLEQNRRFAQQLLVAQEEERRYLARELHDELGQLCNALKVDAVSIARRRADESAAIRATAEALIATADRLHDTLRSLLTRLRPQALDIGLAAAIEQHLEAWERRHAIACRFIPEGRFDNFGEALNIALYRSVQECLNNVARHAAGARLVTVRLGQAPRGSAGRPHVLLTVEDDGCGADPGRVHAGLGLAGMKERLSALGGALVFESAPGKGARVAVSVPLES